MIGCEKNREQRTASPVAEGTIRVAVADDHRAFAEALARVLDVDTGIEVVGVAYDGEQAVELCLKTRPDVVLMDATMPGQGGISATRKIQQLSPKIRVLVLTVHTDEALVSRSIEAGAQGYMLKDSTPEEIVEIVRAVYAGQTVLPAGSSD